MYVCACMLTCMRACMHLCMNACMYMYACLHTYIHIYDKGFFLTNPVLSHLPSSQTAVRCGTYPVIFNNKSLVASF